MDDSGAVGVEIKAHLHPKALDATVLGSTATSSSKLDSHVCKTGEEFEVARRSKLFMDISQPCTASETFPRDPCAFAAFEVGSHSHVSTMTNNGPQVDNTQSDVHLGALVPAEAVPISFPSSKNEL